MAEIIARVGTSQETLNTFAKEALQSSFFSRFIADRDSALVENALIEAGFMQRGDILAVSFVADTRALPDDLSRRTRIYTARATLEGKLVPTKFLGEFMLDIEIDNGN